MSYLNVYFNDELRSKHELNPLITRIGRNKGNDVIIDNPGVSGNHAEIIKNGDKYTVYDLNSTNGVYVNGERIADKELRFGDEIGIFKHKLKFLAVDLPDAVKTSATNASAETGNNSNSATVEVDISKLNGLLKKAWKDRLLLKFPAENSAAVNSN
nr:FHA domain-containing protein [Methylomarinum sp. Ch1-1]MDP4521794.1 FHA domain-containing protein [Methylomarinum sp. Ch1-1]